MYNFLTYSLSKKKNTHTHTHTRKKNNIKTVFGKIIILTTGLGLNSILKYIKQIATYLIYETDLFLENIHDNAFLIFIKFAKLSSTDAAML